MRIRSSTQPLVATTCLGQSLCGQLVQSTARAASPASRASFATARAARKRFDNSHWLEVLKPGKEDAPPSYRDSEREKREWKPKLKVRRAAKMAVQEIRPSEREMPAWKSKMRGKLAEKEMEAVWKTNLRARLAEEERKDTEDMHPTPPLHGHDGMYSSEKKGAKINYGRKPPKKPEPYDAALERELNPSPDLTKEYETFKPLYLQPLERILRQLPALPNPENPHIVDMYCGWGLSTGALAAAYPGATLTVVEKDEALLAHAKSALSDTLGARASFHAAARPHHFHYDAAAGGAADLVFVQDPAGTLPVVRMSPTQAAEQLTHLVRPGGVLVLVVEQAWKRTLEVMREVLLEKIGSTHRDSREPKARPWKALLRSTGLRSTDGSSGMYKGTASPMKFFSHLRPLCSSVTATGFTTYYELSAADLVGFTAGLQFRKLFEKSDGRLLSNYRDKLTALLERGFEDTEGETKAEQRYLLPVEKSVVVAVKKPE